TPEQITHTNISNRRPAWSSDGKKIAYVVNTGDKENVSVIDANGGVPHVFENTGYTNHVAWHPGERIIYSSWKNHDLLDPVSGAIEQLMAEDINGYVSFASYSPDGQRVAFTIAEYEGEWHVKKRNKWTIVIYSLDDHTRLWACPSDRATDCLGWSPDGEWLYLASFDSPSTSINRMRISDGSVIPVVTLPWSNVWEIAMAPSCSTFICVRGDRQSDVWLVADFDPDIR
ncbi:MAG: PD40 domain-containing protein, partial [Candidatus Zixiibacteriota bacterium]